MCSHVRITLWINAVDFSHIFSIVRFISHCIQHCNWPLCFIMLCICCEMYAVWCVCLIWRNGAYVRSLSRGATCHEGPLFLWTSGGRPWQVLLYVQQWKIEAFNELTKLFRAMHCCSFIARDWLQTTLGLQKCDICQITSNNILPARVFWESNQTRIAALLSVIYTVNIRAVLPSWARMPRWRFHLLSRMPLGFCLFGLPPQGGYRVQFL